MTRSMNEDYEADDEAAHPAAPPGPRTPQRCRKRQDNEDSSDEEPKTEKAPTIKRRIILRTLSSSSEVKRLHMSHDGEAHDFAIQSRWALTVQSVPFQ